MSLPTNSYYNQTQGDAVILDAPHLTRFIIDICSGSITILVAFFVSICVCFAVKKKPLQAHGLYYLSVKLLATVAMAVLLIIIVPAPFLLLSCIVIVGPFIYAYPLVLR